MQYLRTLLRILPLLLFAGTVVMAAAPALLPVPGWAPDREHIPAAVAWPTLREQQPAMRLVVITGNVGVSGYHRLARRLHAALDTRYVLNGDDIYHIHDAWIEPKGSPTKDEAYGRSWEMAKEVLTLIDGKPQADVLFVTSLGARMDEVDFQLRVKAFAEAGGVVVISGSYYPAEASPLAEVWPGVPGKNRSWMNGGSNVEDRTLLAGVPTEQLTAHSWINFLEPAAGATLLASGQAGAAALRRVGKGTLVLLPVGPFSQHAFSLNTLVNLYDHDDIWLRYCDTLLFQLVRGTDALPALAHLQDNLPAAAPGQPYALTATVTNRAATAEMQLTLHVAAPRGAVLHVEERPLTLPAGETSTLEFTIPVAASWPAGRYPVYLTVADAGKQIQLHQALQYLTVQGQVQLALVTAQKGYKLGETAELLITASSPAPWTGRVACGVFDFRGRLLHADSQQVTLTAEEQQIPFTFPLIDHGVTVDAYHVQVAAMQDTVEWGRASGKVYKYEPWSMRNEYQWSTWSGIACRQPSVIPRAMTLMAHAGMNALGYPGSSGLNYAAERWGWRYYNEGVGMNTFSPVIEYENVAEIEEAGLKQAASFMNRPEMNSAAFIIGSVGEEAGFQSGWGKRYYWDTPVAPEKACKAFQWYLRTHYPDIATLNQAWGTHFTAFDDVQLTKEFSGANPTLDADGWATPSTLNPAAGADKVTRAPYADTADFYNWYYDQIVDVARKILREKINPRTMTMSSAPTIGSADYDIREAGPSGWYGYQRSMISEGEEPGFGLTWGHFDWDVKTDNLFWEYLITRSGHNNYWVDVPLMFNRDMSHTRASFAMRKWTNQFAGHERIVLDSRPVASQVGILGVNGNVLHRTVGYMATSLKIAATQAGFGFTTASWHDLARFTILFVVGRRSVSPAQADALDAYVRNGGTLVFTPQFFAETEHSVTVPLSPGAGLDKRWQFTVTDRVGMLPTNFREEWQTIALDGMAPELAGLQLSGLKVLRETVDAPGWTTRTSYADGLPALMERGHGKGKLIFLNAISYSHRYIQFVSPTDANRQGMYKLVEALCAQSGARRDLRLDGPLDQTLHLSLKNYADASGDIQYVFVYNYGECPYVAGSLNWLGPQRAAYDVLAAAPGQRAPLLGTDIPLQFRPGAGKLLAFVREPLAAVTVSATPQQCTAGEAITLTVGITAAGGQPVPGQFPLTVRVAGADGADLPGLTRSFSAAHGARFTLETALTDPTGEWTITLTDGISGLTGSARVMVRPSALATVAPTYQSQGWASEQWEAPRVSEDDFLQRLRDLAALYQRDHQQAGWMAKQNLAYYYDNYPGTRHALLRPLNELDWTGYVPAMQRALAGGQTLIVTGEDVNIDPGSGLATWPHADGKQLAALAQLLAAGKAVDISADGAIVRATMGAGTLILCRESVDAAGHRNEDARRWHAQFLARLAAADGWQTIPAPAESLLRDWWRGHAPLGAPSTLVTLADGTRQATLALDPAKPLAAVIVLTLPVAVTRAPPIRLTLLGAGAATVRYDLGCDNTVEGEATGAAATVDLTAPANANLQRERAERDGNYRLLIPLRLTATEIVEITVRLE